MTARDMRTLEFINAFKVARTSTIARLYFSDNLRVAQRRLQAMVGEKRISRVKENEFIYYTKMPKQFNHAIAITDYIAFLSRKHVLSNFQAEYKCGCIRSDALVTLDERPVFIEVQLSGQPDLLKYLKLRVSKEWQEYFDEFPSVYLLSDQIPKNCGIKVFADCTSVIR